MKEKRYMTIIKALLLAAASLAFFACSNLTGGNSSESSSDNNSSDKAQTITITGNISISEEVTGSGALPAEYLFLINQIKDSNERAAFPSYPSNPPQDNYYATATKDGTNFINGDITQNGSDVSFTMAIPVDNTPTTWTIEAGLKDTFNESLVTILNAAYSKSFSNTDPSFSEDFILKPLTTGSGNIDLTINYETSDANTPDTLELYLDGASEPVSAGTGETISLEKITLKNRPTGTYKARLVFKKNGYVVFTDYQGITVFPNLTTNTWVYSKSGIYTPINSSGVYKLTDALVEDYLITQIYVGNVTIGSTTISGKDDKGNGTIFAPFATFAKAITFLKENGKTDKDYTIWISGVHTGPFTIQDETSPAKPVNAQSLTISGYKENTTDKLKGGTSGSVLYLDTNVPVKIKNLTITGGIGTSVSSTLYGGGIYINKGSVELTTGVVVDGNTAQVGGGVYLADGTLYLNDTAVVGKPLTALGANPTCAGTTSGTYANKATHTGGGIAIESGALWLGYRPPQQSETQPQAVDTSGGVIYNLVASSSGACHGGGIDNNKGTVNFAKGNIKYNYAHGPESGDTDVGSGGGIATAYTFNLKGDAVISDNKAADGGGVYITTNGTSGNLVMTGGTISSNTATRNGGAIYQGATFNVSGSAIISAGTEKNNDVYLAGDNTINVGAITTTGDVATITPSTWKRSKVVLSGSYYASYYDKFKISDSDWSIGYNESGTGWSLNDDLKSRIGAQIWVAGKGKNGNSVALSSGVGTASGPSDDNRGTKTQPYATISKAVEQCWDSSKAFAIYIDGTLYGAAQTIPAANTTAGTGLAYELKLGGYTSSTKIDRGLTSASGTGTALTINSSSIVTLSSLIITGGNKTGNGGGIYCFQTADKLYLNDVEITGNTASDSGGGIYFVGTGTTAGKIGNIIMQSTAKIIGNTSSGTGGGVYLDSAKLFMKESALIGDNSTFTTGATSSSKSNSATRGGGIYAASALVYMGYNLDETVSALGDSYGVCHNYASVDGGGIYIDSDSSLLMGSGKISKNGAATNGGGIYNVGNVFLHTDALVGDASTATATNEANSNQAGTNTVNANAKGGGIYSTATESKGVYLGYKDASHTQTLNTGKGVIGNSVSNKTSTGVDGGSGIFCNSGLVKMASGELSWNGSYTSSSYSINGGGIYVNAGTFTMSDGTIAKNYGNCGGGVYVKSGATFTMAGGTIGDSSASNTPQNASQDSNSAVTGGGLYVEGTANLNSGIVAANYAASTTYGGGGMYVSGTATVKNTFRYNSIASSSKGNGIYCASDNCTLNGASFVKNLVYVASGKSLQLQSVSFSNNPTSDIELAETSSKVNVTAHLNGSGTVATIKPSSYAETNQVLTAGSGVTLANEVGRFAVVPNGSDNYTITTEGKLKKEVTIPESIDDITSGAIIAQYESQMSDTYEADVTYKATASGVYSSGLILIKANDGAYVALVIVESHQDELTISGKRFSSSSDSTGTSFNVVLNMTELDEAANEGIDSCGFMFDPGEPYEGNYDGHINFDNMGGDFDLQFITDGTYWGVQPCMRQSYVFASDLED